MSKRLIALFKRIDPSTLLIYGYLLIVLVGFGALCLPWARTGDTVSLDDLFTATSALSTTGLATVNVADTYTLFGEIVILILIQIGGLGYMSLGSFFILLRRHHLSRTNSEMLEKDFSFPDNFSRTHFVKSMVLFTLLFELAGAILLTIIFWQAGESGAIWKGIFHSISAFCTAGFSLFSDSFVGYADHFGLNVVITLLSVGGALGFIVFTDLYDRFMGRKKSLTFTSRIILRFTISGLLIGAIVLFLCDEGIGSLAAEDGILIAFFQGMTAFTTVGFNTYDIAALGKAPLFFLILFMIVGASPSGTGGGMKSTTFTTLYAQLRATFRGDERAVFLNRAIPANKVALATSNFFFYVITICGGTFLLLLVQEQPFVTVFFEAVSALGTVGLSMGITGDLSVLGKLIVIVMMFLGRIGPLAFGITLFRSTEPIEVDCVAEDLAI